MAYFVVTLRSGRSSSIGAALESHLRRYFHSLVVRDGGSLIVETSLHSTAAVRAVLVATGYAATAAEVEVAPLTRAAPVETVRPTPAPRPRRAWSVDPTGLLLAESA